MGNCELLELEVPGPQDLLDPPREAAEHQPPEPQPPPSVEEAGPPRPSAAGAAQQALQRLREEIRAASPEMPKALSLVWAAFTGAGRSWGQRSGRGS
ncbi:unnamed protein product [Prorocentrum cordatum]|uniref:Uncharacterized protein n=1 Tax=Prorocentrum cordatum TaxID=2364126 RepID=A0ABN9WM13_9DINO|nr:unnamed protein product [Polarella glacialis]